MNSLQQEDPTSLTAINRAQQVIEVAAVRNAEPVDRAKIELHMRPALFAKSFQILLVDLAASDRVGQGRLNGDQAIFSSVIPDGFDVDALIEIAHVAIVAGQNSSSLLAVRFIDFSW